MSYQPKTGARCACRPGMERDNCPTCEGTGMVIDFAAIRARHNPVVIRTRQSGIVVELLAQRSTTSVWARRTTDNTLRDYWHSELSCDGGAADLIAAIEKLPRMQRKRAEAALITARDRAANNHT